MLRECWLEEEFQCPECGEIFRRDEEHVCNFEKKLTGDRNDLSNYCQKPV